MKYGYRPVWLHRSLDRKKYPKRGHLPLGPDVPHRPLPATEAKKRPWAVATMFAFLEPVMKPLHENWVRDEMTHDLDGDQHQTRALHWGYISVEQRLGLNQIGKNKEVMGSQVWWHLAVIPAPRMLMQDQECVASLSYILRP